jgi:hypothetical protein
VGVKNHPRGDAFEALVDVLAFSRPGTFQKRSQPIQTSRDVGQHADGVMERVSQTRQLLRRQSLT